jgi:hypothetical protein
MPLAFWVAVTIVVLTPGVAGAEQEKAPSPLERGTLGIEFTGGAFIEAWNLNDRRESLVDGSAAAWWTVLDNLTVMFEFHASRVFQEPSRAAFVNAFAPLVRWHAWRGAPQATDGLPAWSAFVEMGPGISWSDTRVPPRGTEFNYLIVAGGGVMARLGRQTNLLTGFRWLHVSNNSLEGRSRNPDIEALGGYAGISVAF